MSGFVRTIQRTVLRTGSKAPHYRGRGSKLGVTSPNAKDKLARESREKRSRA